VGFRQLTENFPAGGVCGACIFPVRSAVDAAEAPLGVEHTKAPVRCDWRLETKGEKDGMVLSNSRSEVKGQDIVCIAD
jgi:hypothetical protein